VDITKVKIVAPLVNVTASNSYVEFANNSSSDLNIGGWKINGNEKEYYIPKDTIISTRSTLKIPSIVADHVFEDNIISVLYPDGQILIEIAKTPSEEKKRQIAEISQRLTELKSELDLAYVIGDESEPPNTGQEMKIIANADVAPGSTAENDIGVIANAESAKVSQNVLSKIVDFFATMFR